MAIRADRQQKDGFYDLTTMLALASASIIEGFAYMCNENSEHYTEDDSMKGLMRRGLCGLPQCDAQADNGDRRVEYEDGCWVYVVKYMESRHGCAWVRHFFAGRGDLIFYLAAGRDLSVSGVLPGGSSVVVSAESSQLCRSDFNSSPPGLITGEEREEKSAETEILSVQLGAS